MAEQTPSHPMVRNQKISLWRPPLKVTPRGLDPQRMSAQTRGWFEVSRRAIAFAMVLTVSGAHELL